MGTSSSELIEYQILMEAGQALESITNLGDSAGNLQQRVQLVSNAINQMAEKLGVVPATLIPAFKQMDEELQIITGKVGVFGTAGKVGFDNVRSSIQGASEAEAGFADGLKSITVAMGLSEYALLSNAINFIKQSFQDAVQYANQYSNALYQISVAQDLLARGGMNVTQQDLLGIVTQISDKFGVFAKKDMTDAVAQAALLTRNMGFSVEQIKQLVDAASALSIQQGKPDNLERNLDQIVRALSTGRASAALQQLGIDISAADVKAEAAKLHLDLMNGSLSDQETRIATLTLIQEKLNQESDKFASYQDTNAGKAEKLKSAWADALTSMGQLLTPFLVKAEEIGTVLSVGWMKAIEIVKTAYTDLFAIIDGGIFTITELLHGNIRSWQEFIDITNKATKAYQDFWKSQFSGGGNQGNTPTNPNAPALQESIPAPATSDLQSKMESFYQSLIDYQNKLEKAAQDYFNKIEDIASSYQAKLVTMEENYQAQVTKTIEDYNNAVAKEQENFRLQQEQAEVAHQQRMKQIRDNYLLTLEDALRQRDALAVLKAEEKYNLDIKQEEESYKAQQELAKKQEALRLAQMKRDEELRLKQEAEAYELQKKQAAEAMALQVANEQKAHEQQLADLKKSNDQKLQELAQTLADQLGITGDGVKPIYELLKSYYGADGYFDGLYTYSYQSLMAKSQAFLQAMAQIVAQYKSMMQSMGSYNPYSGGSFGGGGHLGSQAQGGTYFANSPTTAVFGEAGPELAIFAPIRSSGGGGGNIVTNLGNAGNGQGFFHVMVDMHPDLQARIVENTMNATAEVITRVNRSR